MRVSMMEITALIISLTIEVFIVQSVEQIDPVTVRDKDLLEEVDHEKIAPTSSEMLRDAGLHKSGDIYSEDPGKVEPEKHYIDPLIKRFVGDDDVIPRIGRKPAVPPYIFTLYDAWESQAKREQMKVNAPNEIPTIRAVKSYYGSLRKIRPKLRPLEQYKGKCHLDPFSIYIVDDWGKKSKRLIFKLKKQYKEIQRLEFVLKVEASMFTKSVCPIINIITSDADVEPFQGRRHGNFLIFDITEIQLNQTLELEGILHVGDEKLRISRRFEPILTIFENKIENPLFVLPSRNKRDVLDVENQLLQTNHTDIDSGHFIAFQPASDHIEDLYHCRKYNWTIDMRIFNWNWYAFPVTINMGFCSGECPFPLDVAMLNSTNYSFLKNRWRVETFNLDASIPGECCTPVAYLPQLIIYYSSDYNFVIRNMPNMKVVSCGCR